MHKHTRACSEYNTSFPCFHLPILTAEVLNEACVQGSTFDYFYGSELSFILTFAILGGFIVGIIGVIYSLVYIKQQKMESNLNKEIVDHGILTKEMINKKGVTRDVIVQIIDSTLIVFSEMQIKLRKIQCIDVVCIATTDKPYIVIKPRNEYDLVLTFDRASIQHRIYNKIVDSLMESGCNVHQEVNKTFKELLPNIISKKQRQKELEIFARVVFAKAFNLPINQKQKHISDAKMENILKMELTSEEFGNLLNMRPDSIFVKLMFKLIVKDSNNYVSFGE